MHIDGIVLTANDFLTNGKDLYVNPKLTKGKPGMLLIWWKSCGHCKRFVPIFNDLANSIGTQFACTSIESEELKAHPDLAKALNFQGFPTIKFINAKGKIIGEYDGPRDAQSILDYSCKVYDYCMKQ
jgi:protein disulfide-isomerase